jgi:cytochrome c-type biogenesis protein CcmH
MIPRFALLAALLAGGPSVAVGPGEVGGPVAAAELAAELGPPGAAPDPRAAEDLTRQISRNLRCPVCQGSSIHDSPVDSAVNMKRQVEEMVALGYGQAQIEGYFVRRYGEWVLLTPRAVGVNWLVWVAPALAAGGAVGALIYVAALWRREDDPVPLPSEVGAAPLDDYERRLLEEIDG